MNGKVVIIGKSRLKPVLQALTKVEVEMDRAITSIGAQERYRQSMMMESAERAAAAQAHNKHTAAHKARIEKHLPKGNMRNKPCPCGSGKKYKNCCLLAHREV